jgi:hypothetical protein
MKISLAAAVFAALFLASGCGSGQGVESATLASPTLAPSPTLVVTSPSLAPSPTPVTYYGDLPVGDLEAGTTYSLGVGSTQQLLVTVPTSGWFTVDTWFLGKNDIHAELFSMTLLPYQVANVYADPCRWMAGTVDPPVGPTVDDLAAALADQAGPGAIEPTNVTIGGYAGKKVELSIPDEVDTDTCHEGDFGRWQPKADPEHYGPFTYGDGQHDTVYIVDVDGTRWVIDTNYLPGTPAASLAELEQLVDSIQFEL